MSLPFILDVAIGLILIYLILSLLASEIQELLTTFLQWRAAHLKKSIEILLTGGEGTKNNSKVKEIVQDLYDNPLIKNISQESKEGIEAFLRHFARFIVTLGRSKSLTLKGNEPSYMPSETFATTLLERLNLPRLAQKMICLNFQIMAKEEILSKIKDAIDNTQFNQEEIRQVLRNEFQIIEQIFEGIRKDLYTHKATLLTSVNRLRDELDTFIARVQMLAPSPEQHYVTYGQIDADEINNFISQVQSIKNAIFYQGNSSYNNSHYNNTDELILRLQPTLTQIMDLLIGEVQNKKHQADQISDTYNSFKEQFGNLKSDDEVYLAYKEIETELANISDRLPNSVRESFAALARRAQINLKHAQTQEQVIAEQIRQFQIEIQVWFDSSMDRASGVYKRNAKGVAFLIGFLLAFAVNADTFHIVNRLTTDSALREALIENGQLATQINCPNSSIDTTSKLECLRQEVNKSIPLPIGRDEANLKQQAEESKNWFFPPLRSFLGWVVSGLAIAMGAPFWFQLLNKVVNVRNSGKPPAKTTAKQGTGD